MMHSLAAASSKCDEFRERLNAKRVDYPTCHLRIVSLEQAIEKLDRGQGLGFVVWGVVVDTAMLNKLGVAIFSGMFTITPIMFPNFTPPVAMTAREIHLNI